MKNADTLKTILIESASVFIGRSFLAESYSLLVLTYMLILLTGKNNTLNIGLIMIVFHCVITVKIRCKEEKQCKDHRLFKLMLKVKLTLVHCIYCTSSTNKD